MNKQKKGFIMLVAIIVIIAAFAYWFINWQNNDIVTTNLDYTNAKIPAGLDGLKILQASDLHNKKFGKDGEDLPDKIKEAAPDVIVITGDLIDYHRTDIETAMQFIKKTIAIAPVYYIPGNHEAFAGPGVYADLSARLKEAGVTVLENESVRLQKDGGFITLSGASDITFIDRKIGNKAKTAFAQDLSSLRADVEGLAILLSHRPEYFDLYAEQKFDLVFSGHAHGGQVRLPGIGGIFSPGQGLFPKYTAGMYKKGAASMVVSRGLGNSEFPARIFNRPELIVVTLHAE